MSRTSSQDGNGFIQTSVIVLGHPVADPHERPQVHDRREHRPLDHELLDLVEECFARLHVPLASLLLEHRTRSSPSRGLGAQST